MIINIMKEAIKSKDFQFYFFSNLANNNVGKSVNQSIIKNVLISVDILNRTVNSSVDIPFDFLFFILCNMVNACCINTKHEGATLSPKLPKTDRAGLLLIKVLCYNGISLSC